MNILGLIPARFASTRFPGKPLEYIGSKTMIEHVYDRCVESACFAKVVIATDDLRIQEIALSFGAEVVLTDPNHPSGTDRCFEALFAQKESYDAIINIQGDEPFILPSSIKKVAQLLKSGSPIATLAVKIEDSNLLTDPNKVKVVLGKVNKAIYFSRAALPFQRDEKIENWLSVADYYAHLGIYGFSASVIEEIKTMSVSTLEKLECLEQLRWLENGLDIYVGLVESAPIGIDTPKDLEFVKQLLSKGELNF